MLRRMAYPDVDSDDDFGTRLRLLRRSRGLTQDGLARQAGLQVSTVARLEQGALRNPRMHTLRKLARALESTVDVLVPPG